MEELKDDAKLAERAPSDVEDSSRYLSGARLLLTFVGFGLSVFLPALEVSVISTSLVTISKDLGNANQTSWIVTAYLLTYSGFLIIWSKMSDIFGVKSTLLSSMVVFMAFSGGCGAASTMTQMIIFRAFQGIGGAGVYAITTIGFVQLVPPSKYSQVTAIASSLMSMAMIVGPLVGGGINNSNHWPWVFYLNLPAGGLALALIALILPNRFPKHADPLPRTSKSSWHLQSDFWRKADFVGGFLLLGASILLTAALQEGDVSFPWKSGAIISFFIISAILWVLFVAWSRYCSRPSSTIESMFPWQFFGNRILMGVLLGCFLSGAPLTIAVIELPQRYQLVNLSSPLGAGVKLLPYAICCPTGILLTTVLTGRLRVPFVYTLLLGTILQTLGFALLSTVPNTIELWGGQYGYSVVAGLGTGATIGTLYSMAPVVVDKKDQSLAIGTSLQVRMLGGALGIAVVNGVLNSYVRRHLNSILSDEQLSEVLQSVSSIEYLPPPLREAVRVTYGEAYNLQLRATIAFAAAHIFAVFLIWKKKPLRFGKDGMLES